jgi:hypothetical protein
MEWGFDLPSRLIGTAIARQVARNGGEKSSSVENPQCKSGLLPDDNARDAHLRSTSRGERRQSNMSELFAC